MFPFAQLDPSGLRHDNEPVIPVPPSLFSLSLSLCLRGMVLEGRLEELVDGPRFVIQNSRKGAHLATYPAAFERNFRSS